MLGGICTQKRLSCSVLGLRNESHETHLSLKTAFVIHLILLMPTHHHPRRSFTLFTPRLNLTFSTVILSAANSWDLQPNAVYKSTFYLLFYLLTALPIADFTTVFLASSCSTVIFSGFIYRQFRTVD